MRADYLIAPIQHVYRRITGNAVLLSQRGLVDRRAPYIVFLDEVAYLPRVVLAVYADHDHLQPFVLVLQLAYDWGFSLTVRAPGGEEDQHGRLHFPASYGDAPAVDRIGREGWSRLPDRDQTLVVRREVPRVCTTEGAEHGDRSYGRDDERRETSEDKPESSVPARG